jgi:hypothetical protein
MRLRSFFWFSLVAVVGAACTGSASTGLEDDSGAGIGAAPAGQPCMGQQSCRFGLRCGSTGVCEYSHGGASKTACQASDECQDGLYCGPDRVCVPAGKGAEGAACGGDGDCKNGLRCDLHGLTTSCEPEGKGDIGSTCALSDDCAGGLACSTGLCGSPAPGAPAFAGTSWRGILCDSSPGKDEGVFRIPRSKDDEFYALPFPSDIRLKDGHPDLSGHPTPGAAQLGFDPVDLYLRATEANADGFSAYPTVFFRFGTLPDLASLAGTTLSFVDVTDGDPAYGSSVGLSWYLYSGRTSYLCGNWLGVRRPEGRPLDPGHTYAVLVNDGVKTAQGTPYGVPSELATLLADAAPSDPVLAHAHAAYAPLRAYLTKQKIAPGSLRHATVFTVAHHRAPIEEVAKAVAGLAAPTSSGWVKCGSGPSPCPDTTGDRACGAADAAFDEYHGLIDLPIFQQGKAPYLTPADGGDIASPPSPVRVEKVCAALTVPKGTMPAGGWPLAVYAHGTGGSFRSHIGEGVAKSLAAVDTGEGTVQFAVLGIDQVAHGPRRAGSTLSPDDLFFRFANPAAARGNPLQGAADQLSLARFAASFALDASSSPTGSELRFDPQALVFWGHSQGATEGAIGVPYAPELRGAVLSGEGASLIDGLMGKKSPVEVASLLPFVLQDIDPQHPTKLVGAEFHPVLSLLQGYIDPVDPLNHAATMALRPPTGAAPHHVFQPYGIGDTYSPPVAQATYALAAGLGLVTADSSVTSPDDLGLTAALSAEGNVMIGDQAVTLATREYAAPMGTDGHFVAFQNAAARADIARFLGLVAQGKTPRVSAQ